MDIKTKNHLAIILIIVASALYGCKKEEVPVVTTASVSNTTAITTTSGGNITSEGSSTVITRGVCWSTGTTPTIADNKTSDGAGAGSFASNLTGLNGATSYYVRAYATNSAGTGYGMALSFTTLGQAPTPTNSATTNITATSATINGSVNPNYISTVVTFEYGTTSSYGSTITAIQSPVTGNTPTNVSASLTGLTVGTSYHYRIKAENSLGASFSTDGVFTTLGQAPVATTQPATAVNTSSAMLNGSVNANFVSSVVTFEYGTTTSYGSTVSATQSPVTGNTTTSVSVILSALTPNTTYHFRIKSVNSLGTVYGNDLIFTTLGQSPSATTQGTSNITTSGATVNGIVNANFLSTIVTFEYGTTVTYDNSVTAIQSPATGNSTTTVSADILGLSPNKIYHYRVKAVNVLGTAYGSDMTFTTLGQTPTVTATVATSVQPFSSTLNGTVNANYLATTVNFEYGISTSYGSTVTAIQSPVTGNTNTNISAPLTGLVEGTTYHYRIVAVNSLGTTNSNDISFTTLGQVPIASTSPASNTTPTGAQLNATVNANYLETIVTFEYGSTASYGNTTSALQSPLNGNTNTELSANITGLTFGEVYHYRVKAVNSLGTTYGNDMTFTAVYAVGGNVNGGIVFYVDGTGLHGLVCAPTDQSTRAMWGCFSTVRTGATGTEVGIGNYNTELIVLNCPDVGIAAKICSNLVLNGYNDWFLPSKNELALMYNNLKLNGYGSFGDNWYFSSSEISEHLVWIQNLGTGLQFQGTKSEPYYVRAVRAF